MITKEGRFIFDYDTVDAVLDKLLEVEIDEHTVSKKSMDAIADLLDLENRNSEEELRAIRNAVVSRIAAIEKEKAGLAEDGSEIPGQKVNYEELWKYSNKISGITAVIDHYKWIKGFPV